MFLISKENYIIFLIIYKFKGIDFPRNWQASWILEVKILNYLISASTDG